LEAREVAPNLVLADAGIQAVIDESGKVRLKPLEPSRESSADLDIDMEGARISEVEL